MDEGWTGKDYTESVSSVTILSLLATLRIHHCGNLNPFQDTELGHELDFNLTSTLDGIMIPFALLLWILL